MKAELVAPGYDWGFCFGESQVLKCSVRVEFYDDGTVGGLVAVLAPGFLNLAVLNPTAGDLGL